MLTREWQHWQLAGPGMATAELPPELGAALQQLPAPLQALVARRLELQLAAAARAQAAGEKIKLLENESAVTVKDLEECKSNLLVSQQKIFDLEKTLEATRSEMDVVRESFNIHKGNAENFRLQKDSATEVRDSMANMIETRNTEIECLKSTIENLHAQLELAVNVKCDVLSKNKSVQSNSLTTNYREQYSEQEKEAYESQIDILKNELQRCTSDLHSVRGNFTSMKIKFQSELDKKSDELNVANAKIQKLCEIQDNLNKKVESTNKKLLEQQEKEDKLKDEYNSELISKTKIADMYKSLQDESNAKNEQCSDTIAELRRLLNESAEKYEELEEKHRKSEEDHAKVISKKNEIINIFKRELENANDLLQYVDNDTMNTTMEDLSPSASIASKLIRSKMSVTQAYDQLVQISEELTVEKNENKRLTHALNNIIGELEEKAPIIDLQKIQHEEALETNAALTRQLDTMILDNNKMKNENLELHKVSNILQKENLKLKGEIEDLGHQICFLLKEIEVKRGKFYNPEKTNRSSFNSFAADDSMDMNSTARSQNDLITFSDINELQTNNQKLLKLVKELSEKRDENEKANSLSETDIQAKLEQLQSRVGELTGAQDRQIKMINKLVEQRDKYMKMCQSNSNSTLQSSANLNKSDQSIDLNTTSKTDASKTNNYQYLELMEEQLADAKKDLHQQREKHRLYVEKYKKSELKLMETNGSLHKQYTELQSKYAKSLSSSEVVTEKLKHLNMDLTTYKKEIAMLNNKINSYTSLTGKQESSIKIFYEDLSHSRAKLSEAESMINNLKTEQSRMRNDLSNDRPESTDRSSALKNIESIKNTIQEESSDGILKLETALEEANRTCSTLRCMLQEEQEKYHNLALHLKQEIDQSKLIINEEKIKNKELQTNIDKVQKELDAKCNMIEELNKNYTNILYSDKDVGLHRNDTNESQSQIKILQEQLEVSKGYIEKYCKIYESSEIELKSLNETYFDYKQKTESMLETLQSSEKQLRGMCAQIQNELDKKSEELTISQSKYNALSLEFNEKSSLLEKALSDVTNVTENAQGVEEKYGLEIILHSNDIQTLGDLKDQLLQTKQYANDLTRAKLEAESLLQASKINFENSEKMLIAENAEIKTQINDLRSQNSILHDQIQALSTKLTMSHSSQGLENQTDTSIANISSGSLLNDSDAVSSEQLLDIIKYLRKEKDVLLTKFDITQAENLRLRSQLETIETRLDEAKLISGSDKTQPDAENDSVKHSGIIRKIETLNAISDCYMNLYKERDDLLLRIEELSDSCNKLQESINPLKEKNAELSMNANLIQSENSDLKKEISKWKNRVNTLIGRDNQPFPEDWKKNQNERESLGKMLLDEKDNVKRISEEAAKLKSDNLMLEEQIEKLRKEYSNISETFKKRITELNNAKKENDVLSKELTQNKLQVEEKTKEIATISEKLSINETALTEIRNKELQVRKVAKKFKDQCDDLTKKIDEEKQKSDSLIAEAAASTETQTETRKGYEQKTLELKKSLTDKLNVLNNKISTYEEENKKLLSEIETLKISNHDTEEKAKQLIKQAKTKIVTLTESKENLTKELSESQNKINQFEQNRDEHDVRLVAIKSQFDGRVAKLEKEKSQMLLEKQGEVAQLNRQIESLLAKLSVLQRKVDSNQTPKPSTSSNQSEKTGTEPPTANIKPMTGVASPRDVNRRVSGETPFASIRPMASHSGVRTAAVLPTTAQLTSHTIVHHQTPHTTGVSADMTSSSPSSSHHITEYLPTSSSPTARLHTSHSRHVTLPPPESTQDMDTDNVSCESDQSIGVIIPSTPPQSSGTGQVGPQQGVALVMPRIETSVENQNLHIHQQQASSSSNNNSSSTVTTTHAQNSMGGSGGKSDPRTFKRPRMTSARPQQKTILKRPKIQRIAESESEYQLPTSSQRDQEDDNNFGDSDDEEYMDRMCEIEEDELEKARLEREERITEENNVSADREASGNNEAEVTNNVSQDNRNRAADDENAGRSNQETHSADHGTVPAMLPTSIQEQQIETISSGNGIDNSFLVIGGASVSGVTSAGVGGNYEDGDDSIVPSTPTLYMPTRNDGFGEAVRSPMTVRGQSTNEGRFTFNESTANATGGTMEDTHADLAPQLTPHNHASPDEVVSVDANVAILESSEAEPGVNNSRDNTEEESPTVSSQGNPSTLPTPVEEGREAEASSTAGINTPPHPSWRGIRGMKSTNRGSTHVHTPRPPMEHQRVVWGSDGSFRRGNSYSSHRASPRGGRHPARRQQTFFKRF